MMKTKVTTEGITKEKTKGMGGEKLKKLYEGRGR